MDLDETLGSYVRHRLALHTDDSYMGVPISKFPEDLRVYEHLLYEMRANAVIEIGVQYGGSTLWFRDRLLDLRRHGIIGDPTLIAIDIGQRPDLPDDVMYLQADIRDETLPQRVRELLPAGARPFIVEDSAHTYDTTMAALNGFAAFVPVDGYMVVEDTCVDDERLRISTEWPRGAGDALRDWLREHREFVSRRELERYGVTCHPGGFLHRIG